MTPYRFTQTVGIAAVIVGVLILLRDAVQVHSIPYGIAGVGLLAFGAWRLQIAGRLRP
jgi:F0F1-type ATP synthase assembly protein I